MPILLPGKAESRNNTITEPGKNTYIDLDDLVHAGASGGQDSLDVITANLCLGTDVALDQVRGGVGGDLAGDENLTIGADGLGLWFGLLGGSFIVCAICVGVEMVFWSRLVRCGGVASSQGRLRCEGRLREGRRT